MEPVKVEKKQTAEADATIARRLENALRVVREDEARLLEIIKVRRLERRARRAAHTK